MNKSCTPRILFSIRLTEILHITLIMFAILGSHGRAKWILVSTFLLRCTISYMEIGKTHRVLFLLHVVPCCLPQFSFSSQISIVIEGLIAVKSQEKLEQVSLKPVTPPNTPHPIPYLKSLQPRGWVSFSPASCPYITQPFWLGLSCFLWDRER